MSLDGMTLAEFEHLCLHGPLESLTVVDEMQMEMRVHKLMDVFRDRIRAQAKKTEFMRVPLPKTLPQRVRGRAGIEHSLPAGDRA